MSIKIDNNKLWKLSAKEVIKLLDANEVSKIEVIDSALDRIKDINPKINAVPIICSERAYDKATNFSAKENNILKGLPILIKDLNDVKGVRTTHGSEIYKDNIANNSDILVQNIEKNGGIVLGKTNTPEFGAGSNTFNNLFGTTKNPWNTDLTPGGSSGGSAAALATGMAWLATGSDLGGSLRNPAGWCGVTGLRPTVGVVAHGPSALPFNTLSVDGPMARNIEDLSIFLDSMTGVNSKDPLSGDCIKISYFDSLKEDPKIFNVNRRCTLSLNQAGENPN